MPEGLDVIIIDDDPDICQLLSETVKRFYSWGEVITFSDAKTAKSYCLNRNVGIAIFIIDVFLGGESGFFFLDSIENKFPTAHSDSVIITGNASDDIVNMCIASDVNHLLEKPVKPYALQLAVRAIAEKYLKFAKRLFEDPDFAKNISFI